jgi:diguanylate cyclase (GGDEF)-like protein
MNDRDDSPRDRLAAVSTDIYCLVDVTGHIVAAESPVTADSASPHANLLRELLATEQFTTSIVRVAAGDLSAALLHIKAGKPSASFRVHLRRLAGPTEPLILVRVEVAQPTATTDPVTGLPDRRALAQRVAHWQSSGPHSPYALLFADLDDFKQVNDQHGHAVGDRVLAEVADRLVGCVREHDLVVRYGGDEFVFLLKDVNSHAEAELVADRIRTAVSRPIADQNLVIRLGITIGAALAQDNAYSIEQLIETADRAMYARKKSAMHSA